MGSKFHCKNLSDNWIVAVDDVYMVVLSRAEAMAIYDMIGEIEGSPFGSANVLPPQYTAVNIFEEIATEAIQTISKKVNPDYVAKHLKRDTIRRSQPDELIPLHKRLAIKHQFYGLFG
jgi:hypothetical protein